MAPLSRPASSPYARTGPIIQSLGSSAGPRSAIRPATSKLDQTDPRPQRSDDRTPSPVSGRTLHRPTGKSHLADIGKRLEMSGNQQSRTHRHHAKAYRHPQCHNQKRYAIPGRLNTVAQQPVSSLIALFLQRSSSDIEAAAVLSRAEPPLSRHCFARGALLP